MYRKQAYLKIQKNKINEQNDCNEKQRISRILSKSGLFFAPYDSKIHVCPCGCESSSNKDHIVSDETKALVAGIPYRKGVTELWKILLEKQCMQKKE